MSERHLGFLCVCFGMKLDIFYLKPQLKLEHTTSILNGFRLRYRSLSISLSRYSTEQEDEQLVIDKHRHTRLVDFIRANFQEETQPRENEHHGQRALDSTANLIWPMFHCALLSASSSASHRRAKPHQQTDHHQRPHHRCRRSRVLSGLSFG